MWLDYALSRDMGSRRFLRALFAEFIAAFFFLLITIGTLVGSGLLVSSAYRTVETPTSEETVLLRLALSDILAVAFVFGISIAVLVYNIAPSSGGHINPAVTCAFVVLGQLNLWMGILYMIAQFLGAAAGAGMVRALYAQPKHQNFGVNAVAPGYSIAQGFFLEFFGTMLLTYTVFSMAVDPRGNAPTGRGPFMAPLVIGLSVFLAHLMNLGATNCGINPARSFGSAVASGIWTDYWLFFVAPMLGGPVGAALNYLPGRYMLDRDESVMEPPTARDKAPAGATKLQDSPMEPEYAPPIP